MLSTPDKRWRVGEIFAVLLAAVFGLSVPAVALAADRLEITFEPKSVRAGQPFQVYVEAIDPMTGSNDTGYAGVVHISSSDTAATLPPNATLPFGIGTFDVTLNSEGYQTLTATDNAGSSPDTGDPIKTIAASAFAVSAPSVVRSGTPFTYTVTALGANGQLDAGYPGTVIFPGPDGLFFGGPPGSTLTAGRKEFTTTLYGNGARTISAQDLDFSSINGVSAPITVLPFNSFSLDHTTRDLRRGIVILRFSGDKPGRFDLRGRRVRAATAFYQPPGPTNRLLPGDLLVRARRGAAAKLLRRGRVRVGVHVTYTPATGLPETKAMSVLLKKEPGA